MKTAKKWGRILFAVLFLGLCFGTAAQASPGYAESDTPTVKIQVEEAIPGAVRYGREMVFQVTVSGDRTDEVRLVTKSRLGDMEISHYEQALLLKAGTQKVKQSLYLDSGLTSVLFEIQDTRGNVLAETEYDLYFLRAYNWEDYLFAGVLTEDQSRLSAFQGLRVNGVYEAVTEPVFLSAETLPDDVAELSMLDLLLIDQFDTAQLSEAQTEAVWQWVKAGGRLLVGSGAAGEKTTAFMQALLTGEGAYKESWTGFGCLSEADFMYSENKLKATLYNQGLKDAITLEQEWSVPMVQLQNYGTGRLVLCAFSIGDFCTFLETYQNQYQLGLPTLGEWLSQLVDEDYIDQAVVMGGYQKDRYQELYHTVTGTATGKIPDINKFMIILLVYTLIIGPGLFLALRAWKKQSYLQGAIFFFAVLFSFLIFFIGRHTRYDKPFVIYSRIVENQEGTEARSIVLNVRAPFVQQYDFLVEGSSKVEVLHEADAFVEREGAQQDQVILEQLEDGTRLTFRDISAFTPRLLLAFRETEQEEALVCDIRYDNGDLSGTVTNTSQLPLEQTAILFGSHYVLLDQIDPGETVELSGLTVHDTVWESEYAARRIVRQGLEPGQTREAQKNQQALLQYYVESWKTREEEHTVIVGFRSQEPFETLTGTACDLSGITLYVQHGDAAVQESSWQKEHWYRTAWTESGYTSDYNRITYSQETVIWYDLGDVSDLFSVQFSERTINRSEMNYKAFQGQIYLYNEKTDQYDLLEEGEVLRYWQLTPYLNGGSTLRIKYVQNPYAGWEYGVLLPYLTTGGK